MDNKQINVTLKNDVNTLIIREGKALEQKEPEKIVIIGILNAPLEWLMKREEELKGKLSHITVDTERHEIVLICDEADPYRTEITGTLEYTEIYKKLGINAQRYQSPVQLAEFIKMNKFIFDNTEVAGKLVTELKSFKAKVEKQLERADDNRGNMKLLKEQTVESNIPASFFVKFPVFKGQETKLFEVEVYINAETFECMLISPQISEYVQVEGEDLVMKEVDKIKEEFGKLPILFI